VPVCSELIFTRFLASPKEQETAFLYRRPFLAPRSFFLFFSANGFLAQLSIHLKEVNIAKTVNLDFVVRHICPIIPYAYRFSLQDMVDF